MNNFSIDNNNIEKEVKIFQQDNSKKSSMDSNKQNMITDIAQIKDSFNFESKKLFLSKKIYLVFIIIYFVVIIWTETFYRDYLFQKSIPIQEKIQMNDNYKIILKISKTISLFGGEINLLLIFGFVFLLLPLNYAFLLLQSIVYSSYITNTLKMIYRSDRPNWHSEYLTFSCNYGYGNPSGHSLTSICLYLTLSHILVTYYRIKKFFKTLIFIIFIIFAFLIIVTRVILAVHSLNQVLYGFLLGLGLYYVLVYMIGYHKYSSIEFLQHIRKKSINYIYYFIHIFLLILTLFIYIFIDEKDNSKLEENIFNDIRCKIKRPYQKYKNNGLFQSLSITSIIGAQVGINILFHILKRQNYMINVSIIEWNKSNNIKKIILRLLIIMLSSIGIILFFIIPTDLSLIIIFIFKSAIPFFISMLGIHLIGIYLCIYLKIANNEIYKMDALHEITATA